MSGERLRAFIAIPIPDPLREALAGEQDRLRPLLPWASFVRPAGIHLTLHFLGDISPKLAEGLGSELAREVAPLAPFDLCSGGLGIFPDPRRPRVLWVGLGDSDPLAELHRACGTVLRRRKLKVESRRYHPHLTLARFRKPLDRPALDTLACELEGGAIDLGRIPVGEVRLYRSELLPQGARYSVLAAAPLAP